MHQLYPRILTHIIHRIAQHSNNSNIMMIVKCVLGLSSKIVDASLVQLIHMNVVQPYLHMVVHVTYTIAQLYYKYSTNATIKHSIVAELQNSRYQPIVQLCTSMLTHTLSHYHHLITNAISTSHLHMDNNIHNMNMDNMDDFIFDGDLQ